jgi:hypothetical protein
MAAFTAIAAGIGAAVTAGSAINSANQAKQQRRAARETARQLERLESSRQEIVNPYKNVTDLSSMISNPFANLQVATKAAEMQARETDISLASTLDALRATGGGGATALAQAASRAKQGVAASIEQQEARNAQLRAQGQQQMQQMQMQEAARVQQAQVAGQQFMFGAQEQREMQRLNRLAGLQAGQQQMAMGYQANAMAGLGAAVGALAQIQPSGSTSNSNLGGNADALKLNTYGSDYKFNSPDYKFNLG